MRNQALTQQLATLGYTSRWLEYGLLTEALLAAQLSTFHSHEDPHTEHYRYAAFRNYLSEKYTLTDEELDRYMEIAMADKDRTMAGAAMVDLFTKTDLTQAQFQRLVAQMETLGTWTQSVIARQTLLRKLKQEVLTEALFDACFVQGDNVIQEYLIGISNQEQLQMLASEGRTKRIRHMALEQLKRQ